MLKKTLLLLILIGNGLIASQKQDVKKFTTKMVLTLAVSSSEKISQEFALRSRKNQHSSFEQLDASINTKSQNESTQETLNQKSAKTQQSNLIARIEYTQEFEYGESEAESPKPEQPVMNRRVRLRHRHDQIAGCKLLCRFAYGCLCGCCINP